MHDNRQDAVSGRLILIIDFFVGCSLNFSEYQRIIQFKLSPIFKIFFFVAFNVACAFKIIRNCPLTNGTNTIIFLEHFAIIVEACCMGLANRA